MEASWGAFEASAPGEVGIAVGSLEGGPISTFGTLQTGHAWSTMKVPVLVTLLISNAERGTSLDAVTRTHAALAVEASDNAAAASLFSELERRLGGLAGASAAVQLTLRRAGDAETAINTAPNASGFTTWGQSEWSATGAAIFYRALAQGRLLSPADTRFVLSLMSGVVPDQRWGAGSAGFEAPVALKGGWGPESDGGHLVRQTAIVGGGGRGHVMSMLARPASGSYASGAEMLTSMAVWVAETLLAGSG